MKDLMDIQERLGITFLESTVNHGTVQSSVEVVFVKRGCNVMTAYEIKGLPGQPLESVINVLAFRLKEFIELGETSV